MTEQKKFRYPKVSCTRCGECCRIPVVPVTHKDVARLVKLTGKPADRLVRFGTDDEINYDAESGLWIEFRRKKYAMVLRKKKGGECIFQTADRACAVYAARPQTCRTFPYCVEFDDESGRDKAVSKITLNKVMTCNAKRCASIDLDALSDNARRECREDKAYHSIVKRWNLLGASGKSNKSGQSYKKGSAGKSPKSDGRSGISEFLRFVGL